MHEDGSALREDPHTRESSKACVLVTSREFDLSYHCKDTILLTIDPHSK